MGLAGVLLALVACGKSPSSVDAPQELHGRIATFAGTGDAGLLRVLALQSLQGGVELRQRDLIII